jgi:hypothetical protein
MYRCWYGMQDASGVRDRYLRESRGDFSNLNEYVLRPLVQEGLGHSCRFTDCTFPYSESGKKCYLHNNADFRIDLDDSNSGLISEVGRLLECEYTISSNLCQEP